MTAAVLTAAADAAAARRDLPEAARLLTEAAATAPGDADVRKKLAACHRALGHSADALAAINGALALAPRDPLALLMKAALLEAGGQGAEEPYRAALAFLPPADALPPPLRAQAAHAERYCAAAADRRRRALMDALAKGCAASSLTADEQSRAEGFADALAAGATTTVLPGLSRPDWFDPARFGALVAVARQHRRFEGEYRALMADVRAASPYVDHPEGVPLDQWEPLNRSAQWRAAHLWRGGVLVDDPARRCPETMAAWAMVDTPDLAGRSPNLMFSILAPGARIPRHVGVTNARLVVHVPLIVPRGCSITVGNTRREWVLGEPLVFDDTIEHEAENGSAETRVVLIGDAWHPDLTPGERDVLRLLMKEVSVA